MLVVEIILSVSTLLCQMENSSLDLAIATCEVGRVEIVDIFEIVVGFTFIERGVEYHKKSKKWEYLALSKRV